MPRKAPGKIPTPAELKRQQDAKRLADEAVRSLDQPKPDASFEQPLGNGERVVVGCKMPNGLVLQLWAMVPRQEPVMGGGMKEFLQAQPIKGQRVKLNGNAVPFAASPRYRIVGAFNIGYAMTENVPKAFWDRWVEANPEFPALVNEIIFAEPTLERAERRAMELMGKRSGLEPMQQEKDPRVPKTNNPNLTQMETADRSAA